MVDKVRINKTFTDLFDMILRSENDNLKDMGLKDLTVTELHLIEKLKDLQEKEPSVNPKMLMESLSITKGTLSIATTKLIKKNYIEKIVDSTDARKIYFTLKPKAEYAIELHQKWHDDLLLVAFKGMDQKEMEQVEVILNNIKNNLENIGL